MRVKGARIQPRPTTPTAGTNECLSDKYENMLPAHLAQSILMAGMAAMPAPSFPPWPCEMFCKQLLLMVPLMWIRNTHLRKCTRAHWCYDMLGLNRLSADGPWSFSLGVVMCFVSFVKPTGLDITVSFMLDSCHSLEHFSHGTVLVLYYCQSWKLHFCLSPIAMQVMAHFWPAFQLLRPCILSIFLNIVLSTLAFQCTQLPLTDNPTVLATYLSVED